jgi:hypothetical protein
VEHPDLVVRAVATGRPWTRLAFQSDFLVRSDSHLPVYAVDSYVVGEQHNAGLETIVADISKRSSSYELLAVGNGSEFRRICLSAFTCFPLLLFCFCMSLVIVYVLFTTQVYEFGTRKQQTKDQKRRNSLNLTLVQCS